MNSQSDGALFWKIIHGRGPMPAWEGAFPDEQLWQLIDYVRTLAPKKDLPDKEAEKGAEK